MPFWRHFASFLEDISNTFQDFAEKVEPYENTVNMQLDWVSGAYRNIENSQNTN